METVLYIVAGIFGGVALAFVAPFFLRKKEGKEVYCYFDNDQNAYAAENAIRINEMVK